MKTNVRGTSIKAFYDLDDLGARQRAVYETLESGDMSNLEISKSLGLAINVITPRTKELRDAGLVELKGTKVCPYTRRQVSVWGIVHRAPVNLELFSASEITT